MWWIGGIAKVIRAEHQGDRKADHDTGNPPKAKMYVHNHPSGIFFKSLSIIALYVKILVAYPPARVRLLGNLYQVAFFDAPLLSPRHAPRRTSVRLRRLLVAASVRLRMQLGINVSKKI